VMRSKQMERGAFLLAGERRMLKMEGFDLGNSPAEHSAEAVEGKTVLLTTTNGTKALLSLQGARDVVVASYVNLTGVGTMLRAALRGGADITLVCAGQDRQFALEDAACAGRYVSNVSKRLADIDVNDAALAASLIDRKYGDNLLRLFNTAAHGRALAAAGFEGDLAACAAVDSYPVIPIYQDRLITKLGPERER
jgi:2-phosphosulfolactate phosphatase